MKRSRRRRLAAAALLGLASAAFAAVALASPTDPVLVVSTARSAAGASGAWLRIDGVFPGDDLVQIAYPLQLLVAGAGATPAYVRYDLAGGVFVGADTALADGLDPTEAAALLGAGSGAPDGALLLVTSDAIEVQLPSAFAAGPATVQLFVLHDGEAILSNAVPVALEAAP